MVLMHPWLGIVFFRYVSGQTEIKVQWGRKNMSRSVSQFEKTWVILCRSLDPPRFSRLQMHGQMASRTSVTLRSPSKAGRNGIQTG